MNIKDPLHPFNYNFRPKLLEVPVEVKAPEQPQVIDMRTLQEKKPATPIKQNKSRNRVL